MPSIRRNIVANFIGKAILAALGIVFPPIIARLLGMESYGLIGVYASLNGALAVLDLGLTATLTREMARRSDEVGDDAAQSTRDMVRTFEVVFWCIGTCAGLLVYVAAPLIANHWVHAQNLRPEVITSSIRLIGLVVCLQWPSGMYTGGLFGLQRQVLANAIQIGGTILRFVGGTAVLWKVAPTIQAFFIWQAMVAGAQTVISAFALSRCLPRAHARGTFRRHALLATWRFSAGASLISIFAIALTQADNVVLSKLLSLAEFGYYTLAWTLGNGLSLLIAPVFVAVFPRLAQLVRKEDAAGVARLYHLSSQLVSVAVVPAAAVLILFGREVIWAWTGDLTTVVTIRSVVIAIAVGWTLNGFMNVPYALQLAYGWTALAAWSNAIAAVLLVPLTILLAKTFGMVGAAAGWGLVNVGYMMFMIQRMHRRLLPAEQRKWWAFDVGAPVLGTLLAIAPLRFLIAAPTGRGKTLILVVGVGIWAVVGAALAAPVVREALIDAIGGYRRRFRTVGSPSSTESKGP
jgi:O-antigen/teichoic acid export membrane protein